MCRLNILLLMLVVIPTRGQTEEPPRPNAEAKPDAAESLLQPIPEDPEAREKLATQVRALLKQLADDAFATREAATDKLRGIGCRSVEVLEEALEGADAETRFRVGLILKSIRKSNVIVRDALGHPIAYATLDFYSKDGKKLESHKTDDCGRVSLPEFSRLDYENKDRDAYAIIHHDDYGTAKAPLRFNWLEPEQMHLKTEFCVSLVHKDSFAAKRAIRGQVLDENNKPLAGVEVRCRDSRTIDGANAMRPQYPQSVMTDDQGQFAIYLNQLTLKLRPTDSKLVPKHMDYSLNVIGNEPYFPWSGKKRTGELHKIVLKAAHRDFQVRLQQADKRPLDISKNYYALRIWYKQPGKNGGVAIATERFLAGRLANGHYFVRWGKKRFPELVISDESPDNIVLKLLPGEDGHTYRGKVVDAITGEPFEGAIVVAMSGRSEREVYTLTNDEWSLLEKQKADAFDEEASKLLRSIYGRGTTATRSAPDGSFQIKESAKGEAHRIVVMARGMLVMDQICVLIEQLREKGEDWPTFFMMPFAYINVGIPGEQTIRAYDHWTILDAKYPLVRKYFAENRNVDVRPDPAATPNIRFGKNTRTVVPADVEMQISLSSGKDNLSWLTIPKVFELSPGEELDLGSDHVFAEKVSIQVRVVDKKGNPLESMPVRPRTRARRGLFGGRKHGYGMSVLTNFRGESTVLIDADGVSAVKATGMHWSNPLKNAENLEVEFKYAEKPEGPVTIKLTDEQIDAIRNPKMIE